jgi:glycerophosphoryl diester phosphodiesterase
MWSINVNIDELQPAHVSAAHDAGLKLITWTANSKQRIQSALVMGVDGCMTDWPEYFKEQ